MNGTHSSLLCGLLRDKVDSDWALSLLVSAFIDVSKVFMGSTYADDKICVNEFVVPINEGFSFNPYKKQGVVEHIRENVFKYLNKPIQGAIANPYKIKQVIVYTRGDTKKRHLLSAAGLVEENRKSKLLKFHSVNVIDSIPSKFSEQVQLFHSADIFVAPHGSAAANSIFLRKAASYIELRPNCLESCLYGCNMPYPEMTYGAHALKGAVELFIGSPIKKCAYLSNPYGARMHSFSDINFYAMYACTGGNKCNPRGQYEGINLLPKYIWKYNWEDDIQLTSAHLKSIMGLGASGSAKGASLSGPILVAPFDSKC
jgi:hypothetical protein